MAYKDPEKRRAYARAWMRRNPERWRELSREAMRRWRKRHPGKVRANRRADYWRYRARYLRSSASYYRRKPEVHKAALQRRRSRLIGAQGSYTAAEWLTLVRAFDGRCAYCGCSGPLEADHRIPLARGGTNDIGNILPACPSCNRRKAMSTEDEFRLRMQGGPQLN